MPLALRIIVIPFVNLGTLFGVVFKKIGYNKPFLAKFYMMSELNVLDLILEASLLVQLVMGLLLLLSLIGWGLIFRLSAKLGSAKRFDSDFEAWLWSGNTLAKQYSSVANEPERTGLEQVFFVGYGEFLKAQKSGAVRADTLDSVERKFKVAIGKQQAVLEQGLATLASIASVSPYIGLFGTVWGIMTAFIGLSSAESVSLATVAPGIAEALIATAMGLFAAIPASLAFNHFSAKAGALYESRALFCEELTGVFAHEYTMAQRTGQS